MFRVTAPRTTRWLAAAACVALASGAAAPVASAAPARSALAVRRRQVGRRDSGLGGQGRLRQQRGVQGPRLAVHPGEGHRRSRHLGQEGPAEPAGDRAGRRRRAARLRREPGSRPRRARARSSTAPTCRSRATASLADQDTYGHGTFMAGLIAGRGATNPSSDLPVRAGRAFSSASRPDAKLLVAQAGDRRRRHGRHAGHRRDRLGGRAPGASQRHSGPRHQPVLRHRLDPGLHASTRLPRPLRTRGTTASSSSPRAATVARPATASPTRPTTRT